MSQEWRLTVWGVRGSAPRSAPDCLEFGGCTTCLSLECEEELVILDAGSGLSSMGQGFIHKKQFKRLHILLSHLHLDHILGLPCFPPFFDPEMEIHLYGSKGFRQNLELLMAPPYWPVGFHDFKARVTFHELNPGDGFSLEILKGEFLKGYTMQGNHPGGSLLYRLEAAGKSLTYALDCEMDEKTFHQLAEFSRGTCLLIWDAGFSPEHLRPGWGHSTWQQGIALRLAAQAKMALMMHYDWSYSDTFLRCQEQKARQQDPASRFAKEGMVITL